MSKLSDYLKRRILTEGPLSVADFMAEALGHPKYGYYLTRDPLGRDGDFITAPEISQMFGEIIGLWLAENWRLMGQPSAFALVELGPGRGTLMADILRAASQMPGFLEAAQIFLFENSPVLRAQQKKRLSPFKVTWLDQIDALPLLPVLLVANEFFDALPVRQLIYDGDNWHERLVALDADNQFCFTRSPGQTAGAALLHDRILETAQTGDIAEICPTGWAMARTIGNRLTRQGGLAVIIDYGYGKSQPGDSLQAIKGHCYANPLAAPGDRDLTTHVDFEALARAFSESGARPLEIIEQGLFLRRLGIEIRARQLAAALDRSGQKKIKRALSRLIDPQEMGSLFKILSITSGD